MARTSLNTPLLAIASLVAACGNPPEFHVPNTEPLVGTLTQAASCGDLLDRLRADETAKVDITAYQLANVPRPDDGYLIYPGGVLDAGIAPAAGLPASGAPSGAEDAASSAVRYSETNTQIQGVDEGDFVETDGTHVYLLHDDAFYVFDTDPPGSIDEAAKVTISGSPVAMFVADGRAVIFSVVGSYYDRWYGVADFAYLPYVSTNVTIFDVTGAVPVLLSERRLDGSYLDARRHGDVVRVFLSTSWSIPSTASWPSYWTESGRILSRVEYLQAVAAWRDARHAEIAAAELASFVRPDADVVAGVATDRSIDCTAYYLGAPSETSSGLTRIVGFSAHDPSTTTSVAISGYAGVEFASDDTIVLAEPDYRFDLVTAIARQESAIHVLRMNGLGATLVGSGRIDGTVRDSYSIDEADDVVRIVSTEQRHGATDPATTPEFVVSTPVSHVSTFSVSGGELHRLGTSEDLGAGETVQSVRFVGDTAYVVTFRQVDPLFVVDLADPTHPTLRGELTIPGFSTYLHPLDANHLLAIGQSPTWGVALQIFDVTDPAHPTQTHVLSLDGSSSDAQYDPHAFVFDSVTGLLAIPTTNYSSYRFRSELSLFHVSVAGGIVPAGSVDHSAYFGECVDSTYGYYYCDYTATVRRGLFIGDYVYTVSNRAVTATPLSTLGTTTGAVTLPAPVYWYMPCGTGVGLGI